MYSATHLKRVSKSQLRPSFNTCIPELDYRTKQYFTVRKIYVWTKSPFRYASSAPSASVLPSFLISSDSASYVPQ